MICHGLSSQYLVNHQLFLFSPYGNALCRGGVLQGTPYNNGMDTSARIGVRMIESLPLARRVIPALDATQANR